MYTLGSVKQAPVVMYYVWSLPLSRSDERHQYDINF